ncbi:MAG: hypothetical protein DWQ37_20855 [Planctomycetota bacterium]|nr:MAG: hypothetical protein DWQ37_20855 [Planctomycetota bacterium]
MDRNRMQLAKLVFGLALVVSPLAITTGCNLMATAMYVVSGQNTPAEFTGLKDKRVAVVCRPVTALHFRDSSVSRDLGKQVSQLLERNISKIELIDQREVFEWADENTWEDYAEIGKALGADMVVGIDLEEFDLYEGQTLYQGRANVRLLVYDVNHGRDPAFEKNLPQAVYPPNAPIPASDNQESHFRRKFVGYLARQIAHHFYSHDSTVDFANDSTAVH